ncbi:MAG: large conductance mechanosensitive channel protein MscL [Acidimicrobiales bacterium]
MIQEFKDFLTKANFIELAVAFVMGLAFTAVVTAFTEGLVSPFISMFAGDTSLAALTFTINDAVFEYGAFIDKIINFVVVGFVMFLVVKAYNRFKKAQEDAAAPPSEAELLTEIRDLLARR